MLAGNNLKSFPDARSKKTMTLVRATWIEVLKQRRNWGELGHLEFYIQSVGAEANFRWGGPYSMKIFSDS